MALFLYHLYATKVNSGVRFHAQKIDGKHWERKNLHDVLYLSKKLMGEYRALAGVSLARKIS